MRFASDSGLFGDATHAEREARHAKPTHAQVQEYLGALADTYGLPGGLVRAVAQTESNFDTRPTRGKRVANHDVFEPENKAHGVMQVRDDQIGQTVPAPDGSPHQIGHDIKTNWRANARAGVALLAQQYQLATLENPFGSEQEHAQQAYAGYSRGTAYRDGYAQTLSYSDQPGHPDDRAFLKNFLHAHDHRERDTREWETLLLSQHQITEPERNPQADSNRDRKQNPASGEGSDGNLDRRAKIARTAEDHNGDTSMPYTAGHPTCNLFVQKGIAGAGAPKPEVKKADGKMGAPSAAELTGDRIPPGWRLLKKGESPQQGTMIGARRLALSFFVILLVLLTPGNAQQVNESVTRPVLLSAQVQNGGIIYELNGRRVEDRKTNSLLANLGKIVERYGSQVPVFIVIDVRASFSEVGKLETALDKAGLTRRRLFVSNFTNGIMNEIHWDEEPIPIPRN